VGKVDHPEEEEDGGKKKPKSKKNQTHARKKTENKTTFQGVQLERLWAKKLSVFKRKGKPTPKWGETEKNEAKGRGGIGPVGFTRSSRLSKRN